MSQALPSPALPMQDPIEVARALAPLLAEQADLAEKGRRATDTSVEALRDAGLFQMMFPRRSGGVGHPLITQIETIAALAHGCPGTAWAFGLLAGVTASAASMSPEVKGLVFRTGDELVCSVAGQIGSARPTTPGGGRCRGSRRTP